MAAAYVRGRRRVEATRQTMRRCYEYLLLRGAWYPLQVDAVSLRCIRDNRECSFKHQYMISHRSSQQVPCSYAESSCSSNRPPHSFSQCSRCGKSRSTSATVPEQSSASIHLTTSSRNPRSPKCAHLGSHARPYRSVRSREQKTRCGRLRRSSAGQ